VVVVKEHKDEILPRREERIEKLLVLHRDFRLTPSPTPKSMRHAMTYPPPQLAAQGVATVQMDLQQPVELSNKK
jgi:hypothetical protein